MRELFILLITIAAVNSNAQTKKIAFRSHNGDMNKFHIAIKDPDNDLVNYSFGVLPDPITRIAQLDSVILLCDTAAVMVTSEYCMKGRVTTQKSKWNAGKDTVYSHPVFNAHFSLDSIKKIISTKYYFHNPVDKIVFIGFDQPVTRRINRNEDPFDENILLITGLISGLSLIGGLAAWRYK